MSRGIEQKIFKGHIDTHADKSLNDWLIKHKAFDITLNYIKELKQTIIIGSPENLKAFSDFLKEKGYQEA